MTVDQEPQALVDFHSLAKKDVGDPIGQEACPEGQWVYDYQTMFKTVASEVKHT